MGVVQMTEHKFTDDEIIKALELCSRLDLSFEECDKCPYKGKCGTKDGNMPADALDLINRQKAEIEKLGSDRYQILPDGRLELIPRTDINAIKAEAIKEFAERLKPKLSYYDEYIVDALVKEMTEEQTNESQST
jgi:hypothetical protein